MNGSKWSLPVRKYFILVCTILLCPATALAGGFKFPTNGSVALGRGGAFTALSDDLVCLEYNPGGLLKLPGHHVYLGDNISSYNITFSGYSYNPDAKEFQRADPVSNEAGPLLFAPFAAISSDFGLKDWRFALGVFGPSANGSSSFKEDGPEDYVVPRPHHYMMLDKSVSLAFYSLAVAYGKKDKFGLGLTLHYMDLVDAHFTMYVNSSWVAHPTGTSAYDVKADMQVSDRFAMGFTLGGWIRPVEFLEIGASFMGPSAHFSATGHTLLDFQGDFVSNSYKTGMESLERAREDGRVDPGELNGLLAYDLDGNPTTKMPTSFKLSYPMTARLGIRYFYEVGDTEKRKELFDVEFDVVWEGWSVLDSYEVSIDGYMQLRGSGIPGGGSGKLMFSPVTIEKNYKDTWSFRLGGQYAVLDWLTLRLGGYYETGAVPLAYTNVDFASFNRFGLGTGFSLKWRWLKFSFAYSHVFQKDREVTLEETKVYKHFPAQVEPPTGEEFKVGAGTYESSYDIFSAALAFSF